MPRPFSKIRSSAVDGRALNPIFRKTQLKKLHDVLSNKGSEIRDAIAADTGHTPAEIQIEYWLAMRHLTRAFAAINPDQALHEEYAIARSENVPYGREAVGIVIIHPASHTFFTCLMSALVPALAAGNCIIVQAEQSLLRTPRLVLDLMTQALDEDIFETATSPVNDADLDHPHIRVLQNGSEGIPPTHHLVSHQESRVVAVVERDADLDAAAQVLVTARFALRGRSPYAPDLVLVNEWVKRPFLEAVVRHTVKFTLNEGSKPSSRVVPGQRLVERVRTEKGVNVLSWSSAGAVVEVEERQSPLLRLTVQESCLLVHAVTSIDDAIDLSRSSSNGRLGAAYVFTAQTSAAKYICQFLDTPASFVNHVPASLLFMPMAPNNTPIHPETHAPYTEELFTKPKAQFATSSAQDVSLAQLLRSASPQQLSELAQEALAKLPVVKRRTQGITHIGFFQKGILVGGALLLSTALGVTGVCSYYGFGLVRGRFFGGV